MTNNNNPNEKITPLKNSEDLEKLIQELKTELTNQKQETETWKNSKIKTEETLFEQEKENSRLREECADWKREAHAVRKAQAETKQHQEATDFKSEFIKLQQKKGWQWDESQGWVKA